MAERIAERSMTLSNDEVGYTLVALEHASKRTRHGWWLV